VKRDLNCLELPNGPLFQLCGVHDKAALQIVLQFMIPFLLSIGLAL